MMKKLHRMILTLAASALLGGTALADTKTKKIEFSKDVKVGSVLVKRGTYKVKFDEQTNELTILSGGRVVAKSAAKLEPRGSKSRYVPVYATVKGEDGSDTLFSVNLGDRHAVINDAAATADR